MRAFILKLEDDSRAIMEAKTLFNNSDIPSQLAVIQGHFSILIHTITALEARQPLVNSIDLVKKVKEILLKNSGYEKIKKMAKVLKGSVDDFEGDDPSLPVCLQMP